MSLPGRSFPSPQRPYRLNPSPEREVSFRILTTWAEAVSTLYSSHLPNGCLQKGHGFPR
jgi:hypothetical protein